MKILSKLYDPMYDMFCKLKYMIYFKMFLNMLIINYCYYKIWGVKNNKLLQALNHTIKLNGCIIIKLIQLYNSNIELINDTSNNEFMIQMFSQYYENCPIHELEYTKKLFFSEFGYSFDEYFKLDETFSVKSGSVAQVYKGYINANNTEVAIKVVHPEIEYQLITPHAFVKIYTFLMSRFKCLRKYETVLQLENFFVNLNKQINMENEFNNNEYFYNNYSNNHIITIPKPLMKSKNFLIMEFIDGEALESMQISDYRKQIIISFIGIFIKDNFLFGKYIHCDLHEANWKVLKHINNNSDNITYKIVIYDFGYVIENSLHDDIKKFLYYLDTYNVYELGSALFNKIKNLDLDDLNSVSYKKDFLARFTANNKHIHPYSSGMLTYGLRFCYMNNYKLDSRLTEYLITITLLNKNFSKYVFVNLDNMNNNYNYIYNTNMFYIIICEKYNIFHNMVEYMRNTYINDPFFLTKKTYVNNHFDTLETDNKILDKAENINIDI